MVSQVNWCRKFCQLIDALLQNNLRGRVFTPWEIEVLLDAANCLRDEHVSICTLSQYRLAARSRLEKFGGSPMLLSEHLASRQRRSLADRNSASEPQPPATMDLVKPEAAA